MISEKVGFRNWESLKEITRAKVSGDQETLDKNKVMLKKVVFKLTDKPIDFEDMYLKVNGAREFESKDERIATNRFFGIFAKKRGILGKKGVDIKKDLFGRDVLVYNSKESFGEKMEKKLVKGQESLQLKKSGKTPEAIQTENVNAINEVFLNRTGAKVDNSVKKQVEQLGGNQSRKSVDLQRTEDEDRNI